MNLYIALCRVRAMSDPRMTSHTLRLLAVLIETPAAKQYGFDLAKAARLQTGTLYPILARLEAAGWLSSEWEAVDPSEVGRPRRRLYRLTGQGLNSGRRALDEHVRSLGVLTPTWSA